MGVSFFCSSVYSRYISTYYVCVVRIYLYGSTIFFLVEMPTPAFCFLVLLFVGCAPLCMYVQLQEICLLVRLKEHTFGTFSSFLFEMQPTRRRTQNNSRDNHTLPSVSVLSFFFFFFAGACRFFFTTINSTIPAVGSGTRLPDTLIYMYVRRISSFLPACLLCCCCCCFCCHSKTSIFRGTGSFKIFWYESQPHQS